MAKKQPPATIDAEALALEREISRRAVLPQRVSSYVNTAFTEQRDLIFSGAKRITCHTGRRGGKTEALVRKFSKVAIDFPKATATIVERALLSKAANAFWEELQAADQTYKLGIRFQQTLRIATWPNQSKTQIVGADTTDAADKIRGDKSPLIAVDESGAYRSSVLKFMIEDCASAATLDYDGQIILAGTPNTQPKGFFWEMCHNKAWQNHHWTLLDNPYAVPPELKLRVQAGDPAARAEALAYQRAWLQREMETYGWTPAHSKYRREYMGEWCAFTDDRVYEISPRNIVAEFPLFDTATVTYFLGVDVGINDPCAICVIARVRNDPSFYVVEGYELKDQTIRSLAEHVARLDARYRFATKVIDAGGQGKAWQKELQSAHGIYLEAAEKTGKVVAIEALNQDFRLGHMLLLRGGTVGLCEDLEGLPWNEDRSDAADDHPDHTCDAMLYCARAARQWTTAERPLVVKPKPTEEELWVQSMDEHLNRLERMRHLGEDDLDDESYWEENT